MRLEDALKGNVLEGILDDSREVFVMEDAVADSQDGGALNSSEIRERRLVTSSPVILVFGELCIVINVLGTLGVDADWQEVGVEPWSRGEVARGLIEPEEELAGRLGDGS